MKTNVKDSSFGGMLGRTVSVKKVRGKLFVTDTPKRKNPAPTKNQTSVQEKFLGAVKYAVLQVNDPEASALYAKGITDKKRTVYLVALSDFLNAPEVKSIESDVYTGRAGDTLMVTAVDDFMVTKVVVRIMDARGKLLEAGEAIRHSKRTFEWMYTAQVENPDLQGTIITAIATDYAGNTGKLDVTL